VLGSQVHGAAYFRRGHLGLQRLEVAAQVGRVVGNVLHDVRREPELSYAELVEGLQRVERVVGVLDAVVDTGQYM